MKDLAERAMIVKLSISQFGNSKKDSKVTQEVAARHGSAVNMGKFSKHLVDPGAMEPISKAANEARTIHYEQSLPWADDGRRILSSANFDHYTELMRNARHQFDLAVDRFIGEYPNHIENARIALNGLFNPDLYPAPHVIGSKFGFEIDMEPLPTAQDFRVDLNQCQVDAIRAEIEHRTQETIKQAQRELWNRLHAAVKAMHDKMTEDKERPIFRDTLVGNIREIVDLIPRLTLEDDPQLTNIRQDVEHYLTPYDPETLRTNKTARKDTADAAAAILKKMAGYTGAAVA